METPDFEDTPSSSKPFQKDGKMALKATIFRSKVSNVSTVTIGNGSTGSDGTTSTYIQGHDDDDDAREQSFPASVLKEKKPRYSSRHSPLNSKVYPTELRENNNSKFTNWNENGYLTRNELRNSLHFEQLSNEKGVVKASEREKEINMMMEHQRTTITCHNLSLTVKVRPPGAKCWSRVDKDVLTNISGIFPPGMNAILGPTGGGKTSLLDVLAGMKKKSEVTGHVLINGKKQRKNFKSMNGYVVQDDVVMGTLTVKENITFSANLRLPNSLSKQEKMNRVIDVINDLGLTKCADSTVGTEFVRGVSGGERKRTNIGMELITSPNVLFLDEPTTGLDASTANAVMLILRQLALQGRTIIFSIHQPRYSIFRLFDRLMLLAYGRMVYHGPSSEALAFFQSIGYYCEEHNNPPDFFLDVINNDSTAVRACIQDTAVAETWQRGAAYLNGNGTIIGNGHSTSVGNMTSNGTVVSEIQNYNNNDTGVILSRVFKKSPWYKALNDELSPIHKMYMQNQENGTHTPKTGRQYPNGFFTQLRYVSGRTILNAIRNPQSSIMQLVIVIIFALIVGIIYFQLTDELPDGLTNRSGLLFFIIVTQMFSNLSAVELFTKEKTIFIHENSSGYYRISAYYLAKLLCDVIPMRIIPLIPFTIITYFMVGLQKTVSKFFIFFLNLFLTNLASTALGFAVSAGVSVVAIANLLISLIYIIMMVFGGLLVNVATMADWIGWLQYLSIIRYSLNMLLINELKDFEFHVYDKNGTLIASNSTAGNYLLTSMGIKHSTTWEIWQNEFALAAIALCMTVIAYIILRINVKYFVRKK